MGPEDDEGRGTGGVADLKVVARHGGRGEVWGVHTLAGRYGRLTRGTRWLGRVGTAQHAVDVAADTNDQGGHEDHGYAR